VQHNLPINLLGNKGPKAIYKSQYTMITVRDNVYNIKNHASEKKQFTNYVKFSLQYNKNRTILAKLLIFVDFVFYRCFIIWTTSVSTYALGPLSNGRTINS